MIKYLAQAIASYTVKHDNSADFEVLVYGYELLLQRFFVVGIALVAALPLGLFFHVLTAEIVYSMMRGCTGGLHAKYRWLCMAVSVLIQFGPAFLTAKAGVYIEPWGIVACFAANVALLLLYAPADTEAMPIYNPVRRKKLKIQGLIYLAAFFFIAAAIYSFLPEISFILVVTPTIACCFTHPAAYWLFGCKKSIIKTEVHAQ